MATISMKNMLEAGVHFGHMTYKRNPKMSPYIFTSRKGIHIINLQKTILMAKTAYEAMSKLAASGGKVLFVATKKQAQDDVKRIAEETGMYYVNTRWFGGLLTNFKTMKKTIQRMRMLDEAFSNGTVHDLVKTKKETLELERELKKLKKYLNGIGEMKELPDAVFIIDPIKEEISVKECRKLNIPIFALVDTDCNPELIDYPIPSNDDAVRAITLFLDIIASAIEEGHTGEQEALLEEAEDTSLEDTSLEGEENAEGEENEEVEENEEGKGEGNEELGSKLDTLSDLEEKYVDEAYE